MKRPTHRQIEDLAFSPIAFPDRPSHPERVVLIGANVKDDLLALVVLTKKLASFRAQLAKALGDSNRWDVYDMSTKPEKGDALDHLREDVGLVVTCHVPMSQITVTDDETVRRLKRYKHMQVSYFYNSRNYELLSWCLAHRVPLLAYGDQPDAEEQTVHKTVLFERPLSVLYEPV
jgi:hypothetical protein